MGILADAEKKKTDEQIANSYAIWFIIALILGYISTNRAVYNDNTSGDRKVSKQMYNLCLVNICITVITILSFIIRKISTDCNNIICAVIYFVYILIITTLIFGVNIGYAALIIHRYNNNQSLTDGDLEFSKILGTIYIVIIPTIMVLNFLFPENNTGFSN
jgi:uncharacterized membrane protein